MVRLVAGALEGSWWRLEGAVWGRSSGTRGSSGGHRLDRQNHGNVAEKNIFFQFFFRFISYILLASLSSFFFF